MTPRIACIALLVVLLLPGTRNAQAGFHAAEVALAVGNFGRVVTELAPLVAAGDARALNLMGVLHQNGWGVPRDPPEAARLYRLAAEQGLTRAAHNLGRLHSSGLGVAHDDAAAAALWKTAARQGFVPSQSALGVLYYEGAGVEKDLLRAYFWWSLAARRFDLEATQAREDIIYRLSAHQKDVADMLVARFEPDR